MNTAGTSRQAAAAPAAAAAANRTNGRGGSAAGTAASGVMRRAPAAPSRGNALTPPGSEPAAPRGHRSLRAARANAEAALARDVIPPDYRDHVRAYFRARSRRRRARDDADAGRHRGAGRRSSARCSSTCAARSGRVFVGQRSLVDHLLLCFFCQGHALIEGAPGLGKTVLVRTLGEALNLSFSRIQCTPDLMPADVTGTNLLAETSQGLREFSFRRGPIFANVVLADEINRATPRTQAAFLEALQERHVTVFGVTHPIEEPFAVFATQNPIEMEGTYPLPEAQLDRFFFKLTVETPSIADLAEILARTTGTGSRARRRAPRGGHRAGHDRA